MKTCEVYPCTWNFKTGPEKKLFAASKSTKIFKVIDSKKIITCGPCPGSTMVGHSTRKGFNPDTIHIYVYR